MRTPSFASLAFFACVATSSLASAQSVRRFDFGGRTSPTATGFTGVEAGSAYSAARGYGWTLAPTGDVLRPAPAPQVVHVFDPALLRDAAQSTSEMRFRTDLTPGRWVAVAYLGDLGDPLNTRPVVTPLEGLDVLANGVEVVADAVARTLTRKASIDEAIGGYKRVSFEVDVPSGALELGFRAGVGATSSVMGLELYPHRAAPLAFDHTQGTLVASSAHAALLAPALQAFQNADYALMRSALTQVGDPLARAWGQAWLLGWLTGEEGDADLSLLQATRALLEGSNSPDDIRVADLLAELRCFERGIEMNTVRGYSSTIFPLSLDNIVYNLCAAAQLFEQIDDDLLRAADPFATPSPFFARAQFLAARNLYSRNTHVGDPTTPFNLIWLNVLRAFAPRTAWFPKDQELHVFTWFATNFAMVGGLVGNWRGIQQLPPIQPAQSWWAPHTEYADHAAAPMWANHQRAYLNGYRAAGNWWMERRLFEGELGGGGGDDVEGAGLLSLPTIVRSEPGHLLERGVAESLELVLFGPEVNVEQGYFGSCGDVEHAGEYTTNPLFALLPTNYGDPRYLNAALRTVRNFDDAVDPQPWSQLVAPSQRHFRAYTFGATSTCGAARDIPLNMRAIIPGFTLQDYSGIPRLDLLFDQLARAWAANALSTAQGKPAGIFPSAVSLATPPVFGTGGNWWTNGGYVDLPSGSLYHPYLYTLLLSAYSRSSAPDRALFIEPVYRAALLVDDLIRGVLTGTQAGQPQWTADTLKSAIAKAAFNARSALASDPTLALSAPDLARIDRVIDVYAPPYAKYRNQRGAATRDKTVIEATFADARAWLRYMWVMGTSSVTYTDRMYVFAKGSHQLQYSCVSGGDFDIAPTFPLTWANPNTAAGELDVAILVNDVRVDGMEALLFNFDAQARDIDLRVWRGIDLGDYELRIGDDANHDDAFDSVPHTVIPVRLDARGKTLRLPQVRSGVLQLVQLAQVQPLPPAPSLLPDPALSAHDVRLLNANQLEVAIHNLGAAPVPAGTLLEIIQGGTPLASRALSAIAAPLDLSPRSIVVQLAFQPPNPSAPITVRITPNAAEITTLNNQIELIPARPDPTVAIANVIGFGRFDVQIDSTFDAGDLYWIGVSASGSTPGVPIGNGLVMPIVWDAFTTASLEPGFGLFANSFGVLDGAGRARMQVSLPRLSILVGLRLTFAGATADYLNVRGVSSPIVHSL